MDTIEQELQKMLGYDVEALAREEDFGKLGFHDSVPTARRTQKFYAIFPLSALPEMPDRYRSVLQQRLQNDLQHFNTIKSLSSHQSTNQQSMQQFRQEFTTNYDETVHQLMPVLCFALLRVGDVNRLEAEGRTKIEEITKQVTDTSQQIATKLEEVEKVLADAKEAAGLTAVTTQATFFESEANEHAAAASSWKRWTIFTAVVILIAAAVTLPLHKIPWLEPKTPIDSYQLIASKLLLFAVLSYMLVLCARNFMSHKHNVVVNKHRQNALQTFKALADAATDDKMKDVILTHASACIFSPQETGYTKAAGGGVDSKTVFGLISTAAKGSE